MPAPDYQTLYDFETQIETAWKDVLQTALAAAGITCQVVITRDSAIEDTPRIELQCTVGAVMTQRRGIGVSPYREVPNAFTGRLSAVIVTTRPTNDVEHGVIRGLLRYNLSASANVITSVNLPYLQIMEQLAQNSPPSILDEKQQDKTLAEYEFWFAIRNEAWPPLSPVTMARGQVKIIQGQQTYSVVINPQLSALPSYIDISVCINGSSGELFDAEPDSTTITESGFSFILSGLPSASGAIAMWKAVV